ncbi:restriction endonuclease subunit S [Modestobacter sp. VKM Ac-2979]|uniref:restriction endonuclease subunit S n=1 Tax=unclassified Modestobacter TaxID=2643866 RepID=UPI0022AB73AE|nr:MULTISPECIES: restriction endonuclease subunit S [unclassified Modestobacter]MCZ2813166.1 restriction endonuclease subunit S [Modestobacter sp. VKM Ac-2979]MCZ2842805.1 restriction endonuclease subunit S [Modestobacter sp. VKM Ac-2980]
MSEWPHRLLGDLIHVKHGFAFKGEHFTGVGDKLVLKPGNFPIGGGIRLRPAKDDYYTGTFPPEFELAPGDLLVVMTDLTQAAPILGSPAFVPTEPVILHNQRLGLVTIKPDVELDEHFLYYLLLSDTSRSQIRATATGATVRHTAPERIYKVRVAVPELKVQERVGEVLWSLDALIENNRRRAEVLEGIARTIYHEWFVHFRFPGHENVSLVDSDIGRIPEGWEVLAASTVLTVNPRVRVDKGAERPFFAMADLREQSMVCAPSARRTSSSGSKFENGDTLFARITPCLENGKTGFVQVLDAGETGFGSTEFIVLRGRSVGPAFTYCLARSESFRKHAIGSMSGASGRQRVRNECFDSYLLTQPPRNIADQFETAAAPLFKSVEVLRQVADRLQSMRDSLLPKLVTGQVDVSRLNLDPLVGVR